MSDQVVVGDEFIAKLTTTISDFITKNPSATFEEVCKAVEVDGFRTVNTDMFSEWLGKTFPDKVFPKAA